MKLTGAVATVTAGIGLAAALGTAGYAAADTPTGSNAADIVKHLQDEGYTVQLNMPPVGVNLSSCTVSGISGLTLMMTDGGLMAMMAPVGSRGTAYVTLACPDSSSIS
ncbi:MAG: hypothetical protein ACOYB7_13100 [Mycobacterium sp.]